MSLPVRKTLRKSVLISLLRTFIKTRKIWGNKFFVNKVECFFILGSGRSGNTLLRALLSQHPDISIPPETYVLGKIIRKYALMPYASWNRTVNMFCQEFLNHPEFMHFKNVDMTEFSHHAQKMLKEDQTLCNLFDQFYRFYANKNGKSVKLWGDKTPLNTLHIHELLATFPHAKFIVLRRSPFDVVSSYLEAGLYANVEDAYERWEASEINLRKLQEKNAANIYDLTYENLVTNTDEMLLEVCNFLNIDKLEHLKNNDKLMDLGDVSAHRHHQNVMNAISDASIGIYTKRLNETQFEYIKKKLRGI